MAEAAFQDPLWRRGLESLTDLAELRIVRCNVTATITHDRAVRRSISRRAVSRHQSAVGVPGRTAHADTALVEAIEDWERAFASFDRVSIPAPAIDVDTTDGYAPDLAGIVAFINQP